jgi:hypothetical protein
MLGALDTVATSLGGPFPKATTAAAQGADAQAWANTIHDLSVTIDNKPINTKPYRVATDQFSFAVGGPFATLFTPPETKPTLTTGTAEANGYYLILKPLSAGSHTIHVSGMYVNEPGVPTNVDTTLLITVAP